MSRTTTTDSGGGRGGFTVALLGAESTGKTTLGRALVEALAAEGRDAVFVGEALREFCDLQARTPRQDEQAGLAAEQARRIDVAAAAHAVVVADTTALMIAVYSDLVFGDTALYPEAERLQRRIDLTLLTALDLPWQADGLQRDGPHVREPVDAKVRAALMRSGAAFSVVAGAGPARLVAALAGVRRALERRERAAPTDDGDAPWRWRCTCCGDPACERRLLPTLR